MTRRSTARLSLTGELTIMTAAEHHQRLQTLLARGAGAIVDLSGVSDLDTAGLQVLLVARREATRLGVSLVFRAPSEPVQAVLAVARLTPALDRAPAGTGSEEDA